MIHSFSKLPILRQLLTKACKRIFRYHYLPFFVSVFSLGHMTVKFDVACVAGGISCVSANFSNANRGKKAARLKKYASPLAKIPRGLYPVGVCGAKAPFAKEIPPNPVWRESVAIVTRNNDMTSVRSSHFLMKLQVFIILGNMLEKQKIEN